MADLTADFEAGVNGNTITTAAGEASATQFELVVGSPTYDNTRAAHGTLSGKFQSGAARYISWDSSVSGTDHYGRIYYWFPSITASSNTLVSFGGHRIATDGGGKFFITNNSTFPACTTNYATGQWIRIEWGVVVHPITGSIELKLFNDAASTTPTQTIGASGIDTGAYNIFRAGPTGDIGIDLWQDDIVANATSYPGPVPGPPSTENLAPVIYGRGAC